MSSISQAPLLPVVSTCLLLFIAYRFIHALFLSPLRKVPGPLLARLTAKRGDLDNFSGKVAQTAERDADKYGPVYVYKPNAVCVSHPDDVRTILGSQDFRKAPFFDIFDDGGTKNIVSQRDPALASRRRRQIGPYLNFSYLHKMEDVIQRHGYLAIQAKWERMIDENSGKATEVNYRIDTQLATFDIMSALAFGRDPSSISKGSSSISSRAGSIMDLLDSPLILGLLSLIPFTWLMLPWKWMYQELADYSRESLLMRKKLRETGEHVPFDMLQAFVEAEDPESKMKMSSSEIQAECIMMMLAGSETTSSAIMWTIHLLLLHPDKLERAVEEVRSTFPSDHLISHQEVLSKLPYIDAVVSEALRVSPTTAGLTPRVSQTRGISLQGHYIPPGTEIFVNLRSVNMHDGLWEQPRRFQPERFLDNDEAKKTLFTFSYGPRNCIGRNLAWVEMLTIVANLLKDYDIRLPSDSRFGPSNVDEEGVPRLLPAKCFIASFPANPDRDCRMVISRRS
ncbi:cytochrome P450 [Emericellopsis atlantica]|uniref:Cytochrome P450 n=1 Tax=Emericellopsis atlantica TaxID=2614577 RepID=A0A9P7ZD05_9HYPO|nr:cytochrome P450 [Emericellopsis atlantica]KAG9249486.1 cytochrome P450 [Emericellopsis atlantica]